MQVVQGLYEGVDLGKEGAQGLVSYIRTDSVRVSDEALAAGPRCYRGPIRRKLPPGLSQRI